MNMKEQKANEYSQETLANQAFKAGWEAALDYFSNIPFDKMMEEFTKHFEEMEERK